MLSAKLFKAMTSKTKTKTLVLTLAGIGEKSKLKKEANYKHVASSCSSKIHL